MQTNVIWCPMLATVCNLTAVRDGEMIGGDFAANMDGIEHYAKFGHRGRLQSDLNKDLASNPRWVRVPYRYRQAILFEGNLPHLSTKLLSLPRDLKRVIIGINVFDHRIGPAAERCTIHSARWRRAQKLYSVVGGGMSVKYGIGTTYKDDKDGNDDSKNDRPEKKIEISRIRETNPVLYRLLKIKCRRDKEAKLKQERAKNVSRACLMREENRFSSLEILRECFPKVWIMISDTKTGKVRPTYVSKWMRHEKLSVLKTGDDEDNDDINHDLDVILNYLTGTTKKKEK